LSDEHFATFSPICKLSFNLVDDFLCCAKASYSDVILSVYFLLLLAGLLGSYPKKSLPVLMF
jgi:hypothetical protein